MFRNLIENSSNQRAFSWPTLGEELGEYRAYLNGKILNAGSGIPTGDRDITPFINGELVNLDIFEHEKIHITAPLDDIPCEANCFDTVFCNAVLEHVSNPVQVVDEMYRVLKPGGHLYVAVPFMQPEHLVPTDYQRYTIDGLKKLVTDSGFTIITAEGVHNVYITIGWVIEEWLRSKNSIRNVFLRCLLFPPLRFLARNSHEYVHSIASVYRVLAVKN